MLIEDHPTFILNRGFRTLKAVILSAGQGKRLLPLTENTPKALLDIQGRPLFAWQVDSLAANGVTEIVIVTGYNSELFDKAIEDLAPRYPQVKLRSLFNPFYSVADNLASCWMARSELQGEVFLINGDTLFHRDLAARVAASPDAPITLAIDQKSQYDEDDMKVGLDGTRLIAIGKTLTAEQTQAESIGFLFFRKSGSARFVQMLEDWMRDGEGLRRWYLSAIHALSSEIDIQTRLIAGHEWCEVDYPQDHQRAQAMVSAWS